MTISALPPPPVAAPTLPGYISVPSPATGPVNRTDYNSTASPTGRQQTTVSGIATTVPVIYGVAQTGASGVFSGMAQSGGYAGYLVLALVWAMGECEAVLSVKNKDGTDVDPSVVWFHYTGAPSQTVNTYLQGALSGWTSRFVATVLGVTLGLCYSVALVPPNVGLDEIVATIKGRKVYNPSTGLTAWSDNPALCWADFETNPVFGRGRSIDWASVTTASTACDDTADLGEKRRTLGLVMDKTATMDAWSETFRGYAGCFLAMEGNTLRMIPDRPGSSVRAFTDADILANNNGKMDLAITLRSRLNIPTVVRVQYTDTTTPIWTEQEAVAYAPGVVEGTEEWRESVLKLPGVQRHSQAMREATEWLNKLAMVNMDVEFQTFDEALALQVGDIITLTSSRGLSAKPLRIVADPEMTTPGWWRLKTAEYQPNAYSNSVQTTPAIPDTNLPAPGEPPAISGLTLVEEVYALQTGVYASRVHATWAAPSLFPFVREYRVTLRNGGDVIFTGTAATAEYRSPAIQEGVTYQVVVTVISTTGAASDEITASLTAQGKALIPGDVPSVAAFEAGGEVFLSWVAAVDIDIWRYEVRYGATAGSWSTATILDRVDGLRARFKGLPEGKWRFHVKAVDSVRNYSANDATVDVTVTQDKEAFFSDTRAFSSPTLVNMTASVFRDGTTQWVTDMGDGMGYGHADPNNATGYWNDGTIAGTVVAAYPHTSGASSWTSESWDVGQLVTGNWLATVNYTAISGSVTLKIQLSPDNSAWADYTGSSAYGAGRYARIKLEATGSATFSVNAPPTLRVAAIGRTEQGQSTSVVSGPTTITLANKYAKTLSINIQPVSALPLSGTPDNIQISTTGTNTFDVYIFDSSGIQVANSFLWEFKGL